MINTIYELLLTILNKELRGNVTPAEFNLIAKQVQDEIYRGYFEDENRDKNRENRGLTNKGYSHLSFNQRQRIDEFSALATLTFNDPDFELPSDLYLIKDHGILFNNTVVDEIESQYVGFSASSLAAPSTTFPTYELRGSVININPSTIQANVTCRYIRTPLDPNWTYTIVSGTELFNQAANDYQDFELHPSEFSNIAIRMLSYFGINIRETELTQYAESLKSKEEAREEQ